MVGGLTGGRGRRPFARSLQTFLAAALVLLLLGGAARAEKLFVINTAFGPPLSTPEQTGFFDQLMIEVFARIGMRVIVDRPPAERALRNASAGVVDADGPRIAGLDELSQYPNLIRVPESVHEATFTAFSRDPDVRVSGWDQLAGYDVGVVRGWKIVEQNTTAARSVVVTKTAASLFSLLETGRIDLAIIDRSTGETAASAIGMNALYAIEPPLEVRPMFLYLNTKHTALLAPIEEAIKSVKRDGTYAALKRKTLQNGDGVR